MTPQTIIVSSSLILSSFLAHSQVPGSGPEFEVASIKPAADVQPIAVAGKKGAVRAVMGGMRGGPGTADPGQVTATRVTLKSLVMAAYGIKPYQIAIPDALNTGSFDIAAKVPPGATRDDVKLMWQRLLAERFKLTLHHETREVAVYALVVAKNGPKMKESEEAPPVPPASTPEEIAQRQEAIRKAMSSGKIPPGVSSQSMSFSQGRVTLQVTGSSMAELANTLTNRVDRPVLDATGLTKKYDFSLSFAYDTGSPAGAGPPLPMDGSVHPSEADTGPPLPAAVQEQLGLKLEQRKMPFDFLVIDHAEKTPVEN